MNRIQLYLLLLSVLFFSNLTAQNSPLRLTGEVKEANSNTPLSFATVIIEDALSKKSKNKLFTQSDEFGYFEMEIDLPGNYNTSIYYLGYRDSTITIKLQKDTHLIILMEQLSNELQEVVVRDTFPPIVRSGDTVIYNPEAFAVGNERKLRDLVEKLPGLSIDEDNNVTYQGEEVATILVEGEPFFGGNSELALNGIPADAVDKIQALENYEPLGLSLDPALDKKVALNVQLKPDRKNIIFGDLGSGGGLPNTYTGAANLYNYSPKRNLT
ncbi:hypothetical protein CEQ90_17500 [Lewinellaceae bacterium SD302]|nr:hypothetical protein CEQ90_17500 [Lewinellaceae bacterium SD302]